LSEIKARELLKKPYTRVLIPDEESGAFVAKIIEFPGCIAQGNSPAEAYERLEAAAESWIEAAMEMKQEIPPPTGDIQYSGRILLRLPRTLHRQAAQRSELEGVSLNQFIVTALAEATGFGQAVDYMGMVREEMTAAVRAMQYRPPMPKPVSLTPKPPSQNELLNSLVPRRSTH